jgi:hypothetical protein
VNFESLTVQPILLSLSHLTLKAMNVIIEHNKRLLHKLT